MTIEHEMSHTLGKHARGFRVVSLYNNFPGGVRDLRLMCTIKEFYSIDEFYDLTLYETDFV